MPLKINIPETASKATNTNTGALLGATSSPGPDWRYWIEEAIMWQLNGAWERSYLGADQAK